MVQPPTHELSRLPAPLRACNLLARGVARLGLRQPRLSVERILDRARRSTGLSDFGDGDVLEPLEVLVDSLESEADLTPIGRSGARSRLVEILTIRLQVVDYLARHSAVGDEVVRRPLFVVGFPRTGTTMLFNLLAQDPAARPLLGWEAWAPIPDRHARRGGRDPRIRRYTRRLRGLHYLAPHLPEIHPISATGPEECTSVLLRTLVTSFFALIYRVPRFHEWFLTRPRAVLEHAYRLHEAHLKLLQHQRRGERWLLKSPAHLTALDAIAAVYPDVCIVQTHRDLAKVFPSTCSLLAVMRRISTDAVDPAALGRESLAVGRRVLDKAMRLRDELPAARVCDVRYADLVADPQGTLLRIYEHFGLPVPEDLESRASSWLEENRRHKHGVHRYSLESFGIDRAEIDRLGADYMERFGVSRES
jgi:hypothetical protein